MSHVDEGTLHALVDNALDATERSAAEAHLASCGECARRFAEATAMTRQIATLLGALDEPAPRIRVEPAAVQPSRDASTVQHRARRGMFTLRRVALAASVLLVAGVSYEVGKTRDGTSAAETATPRARFRGPAAPMRAVPSVVENVTDSFVAGATPSVRQQPRGGPRVDAELAATDLRDATAPRSAPLGLSAGAAPVAAMRASVPVVGPEQAASAAPSGAMAKAQSQPQPQSPSQSASPSQAQAPAPAQAVVPAVAPPVPSTDVAIDTAAQRRVATAREADEALTRVQSQERERKGAPSATPSRIRVPRELTLGRVIVTGSSRAEESRNAAAPAKAPAPKAVALAGYSMTEDSLVAPTTRRRYFSPTGMALELLITASPAARKESAGQRNAAEFVVTTENGRSIVRWHARGLEYVLEGALTPDSLMKLATQLKP
jgi:hypothetical protein